jgi:hypothetical protein
MYTKFFLSTALHYPNWYFWSKKKPSGNPGRVFDASQREQLSRRNSPKTRSGRPEPCHRKKRAFVERKQNFFRLFFSVQKNFNFFCETNVVSHSTSACTKHTQFQFSFLRLLLFFQFSPPFKVFNFRVLLFPVFTNFSIAAATALNRQHTAN